VSKKRIFQIIGIVTIINILSRLFGFFREVVIGYHFGTSSLADSVILAYTVPNFLYLVLGGAVTTAYISIYNKIPNELDKQQFHEAIFTYLFAFTSLLTVSFMALSKQAVSFFFSGLHPSELKTTSELFFIMSISIVPLIFSMWFSGILNVNNKFYSSSLATLANNAGVILIALILYPLLGVYAYGWGAVAGAVMMLLILMIYVKKGAHIQLRFRFFLFEKEYILRMLKVTLPILLGGATLQFYFLIHRVFASQLEDGYVAALNYASKLVQLPQTILMTAVTTVIYPLLAKKAAEKDIAGISQIFYKGLHSLAIFIIPISIFVYFYADEIVKLVFEYGAFTSQSTVMTANMLKIFVIGMFAHAANLFVTRFFYAMEKSMMPVVTGVLSVFGVNVLIIMLFIDDYGASAIALGTTIGAFFQFFVLLFAGVLHLRFKAENKEKAITLFVYNFILFVLMRITHSIIDFGHFMIDVAAAFFLFVIAAFLLLKRFGLFDRNILKR
jgi:putative peptidoglycan lipid II flippase